MSHETNADSVVNIPYTPSPDLFVIDEDGEVQPNLQHYINEHNLDEMPTPEEIEGANLIFNAVMQDQAMEQRILDASPMQEFENAQDPFEDILNSPGLVLQPTQEERILDLTIKTEERKAYVKKFDAHPTRSWGKMCLLTLKEWSFSYLEGSELRNRILLQQYLSYDFYKVLGASGCAIGHEGRGTLNEHLHVALQFEEDQRISQQAMVYKIFKLFPVQICDVNVQFKQKAQSAAKQFEYIMQYVSKEHLACIHNMIVPSEFEAKRVKTSESNELLKKLIDNPATNLELEVTECASIQAYKDIPVLMKAQFMLKNRHRWTAGPMQRLKEYCEAKGAKPFGPNAFNKVQQLMMRWIAVAIRNYDVLDQRHLNFALEAPPGVGKTYIFKLISDAGIFTKFAPTMTSEQFFFNGFENQDICHFDEYRENCPIDQINAFMATDNNLELNAKHGRVNKSMKAINFFTVNDWSGVYTTAPAAARSAFRNRFEAYPKECWDLQGDELEKWVPLSNFYTKGEFIKIFKANTHLNGPNPDFVTGGVPLDCDRAMATLLMLCEKAPTYKPIVSIDPAQDDAAW